MYRVITYRWIIPAEYYTINDLKLSTDLQEFDTIDMVWSYLDSPEGQSAEGVQVFDGNNSQIFALNPDVQNSPKNANKI